jgi:hypothetical protein
MSTPVLARKPKHFFDTGERAEHVTFDDGKELRRNIPWVDYVEGTWDYAELDTLRVEIGNWQVLIRGYNLGPLFQAIEERALVRLRAQPGLEGNPDHANDTFATEIRFQRAPTATPAPPLGQMGLGLGV